MSAKNEDLPTPAQPLETHSSVGVLSEDDRGYLELIQEGLSAIPADATPEARAADEKIVSSFMEELDSLDDKAAVLDSLQTWVTQQGEENPHRTWLDSWLMRQTAAKQQAIQVTEPLPASLQELPSGLIVPKPTRINGRTVIQTPSLETQVLDDTRTNTFKFNRIGGDARQIDIDAESMTEQEGLIEIYELLCDYLEKFSDSRSKTESAEVRRISGLMSNLNFVGDAEYQAGAEKIGKDWKDFLDRDENRQICVPSLISHSEKYTATKSDTYFRDRILATFTDEELAAYSGRIVADIDHLAAKPDDVLFVIADDWAISGNQMERAFGEMLATKRFNQLAHAGAVAVHSLIAPPDRLRNGLLITDPRGRRLRLPMVAPYVARISDSARSNAGAHISGTHSVVNYDFEDVVEKKVVRPLNDTGQSHPLPALTNVVSPYKYQGYEPQIHIGADKLERRG